MAEKFNSFQDFGKAYGSKPNNNQYQQRPKQYTNQPQGNQPIILKEADYMQPDSDYVKIAEQNMLALRVKDFRGNLGFGKLTTSKIRNILTLVNDIYNDVILQQEDILSIDMISRIRHLKIRLVYEAGRENDVKRFVETANLLCGIDAIKDSKKNYIRFARYLEAHVAYHRFYGGKNE